MKALICYDTKYGSTELVCDSIKSGIAIDADIQNIKDVSGLGDYDLVIIGSPVFIGKPMQSVAEFIRENKEVLKEKEVAIFVTCWAASTEYSSAADEFLELMRKDMKECNLLYCAALPGRLIMHEIKERDRKIMERLLRRIDNMSDEFESDKIDWCDARDAVAARNFGAAVMKSFNNKKNCMR